MSSEYQSNTRKEIFVLLFPCACILVAFFALCCRVYKTEGTSMEPTIEEHSYVVAIKYREINRGDIIAFKREDNPAIKRVIGMPKDQIEITEEGEVKVNGQTLKETYVKTETNGEELTYPYEVPDNYYFVLGDNRADSLDSRYRTIGPIKEDEILGKVIFSLYPPKIF